MADAVAVKRRGSDESVETGATVEFQVHFRRGRSGRRVIKPGSDPGPQIGPGKVPRVSRLMALAIRCDELVRKGEAADYADIARLGHVTRARMSQITNLLNLAPDIQEEILHLPTTTIGRDAVTERELRPIATVESWVRQRKLWGAKFVESEGRVLQSDSSRRLGLA